MNKKIKLLFEYQRFSPNARITEMIETTEKNYESLSDDELTMVAAAGEMNCNSDIVSEKAQKDE